MSDAISFAWLGSDGADRLTLLNAAVMLTVVIALLEAARSNVNACSWSSAL